MSTLKDFNVKFEKTFTIRNELEPMPETKEYIKKNGVIEADEELAEKYKKAKNIIDDLHREFIDKSLSNSDISWKKLADLLTTKDYQAIAAEKKNVRKEIVKLFKNCKEIDYKKLSGKDLIEETLPKRIKDNEDKKVIESFKGFTTYFTNFNKIRENIYTEKEQSNTIAYRIVHENFPKFLTAVNIYKVWKEECPNILLDTQKVLLNSKILEKETLDDVFKIEYYNKLLSQQGIDKFNRIVGGVSAKVGDTKIQGLNEAVNIASQNDSNLKVSLKKRKSAKLPLLFKQILSDRDNKFFLDVINSDEEAINLVKDFITKEILGANAFTNIKDLLSNLDSFDLEHIFIQGKYINILSKDLFGGSKWEFIKDAIERENSESQEFLKQVKDANNDVDKVISKYFYSIAQLNEACQKLDDTIDLTTKIKEYLSKLEISDNDGNWPTNLKNSSDIQKIKQPLDSILTLYKFIQVFSSANVDKDLNFYMPFEDAREKFAPITALYNKVRNYATKKPYSTEKIKLNFGNPQLADGWSESKEQDHLTTIFIKDGKYYLGILNKRQKLDFSKGISNSAEHSYKKMRYYQLDIKKNLVRMSLINKAENHFKNSDKDFVIDSSLRNKKSRDNYKGDLVITKEIYTIYKKKLYKVKGSKELKTWIKFAINFLKIYKNTSDYDWDKLISPELYEDWDEFCNEVVNIIYKIDFCYISEDFINKEIRDGNLYLFQIKNKDYAKGAKGTKNLHTMYFEAIFNEDNLKNGVFKLNGYAELFYRKASLSLEKTPKHKEYSKLVNRVLDNKDAETIPEYLHQGICHLVNKNEKDIPEDIIDDVKKYYEKHKNEIKENTAKCDIVKDRRFTEDKFFFHCPISINYKYQDKTPEFNNKVLDFLKNNPDINIIGIDRGERNLLYITVINQKGNIIYQESLNMINVERYDSKTVTVNYYDKLLSRQNTRKSQKQSWETISKIATLKEGYLSAVVHKLAKLMIEKNAIIVLEKLNQFFMGRRCAIAERAVYQKFEKMLINKLNYLVFKKNNDYEPGGCFNGYQLTNKFTTFEDIGFQTGFLFYVPAAYTSAIDPTTGFANVLNLTKAKKEIRLFFSTFESIKYLPKEDLFKFTLDFSKSSLVSQIKLEKSKWDIYSYGKRIISWTDKSKHFNIDANYSPTQKLKELFEKYNIEYQKGEELKDKIKDKINKNENLNAYFGEEIFYIFKNILKMRNSVTGSTDPKDDYVISPVKNANGTFFDTRENINSLPKNADANGAYHIALKGLMILKKNDLVTNEKDRESLTTILNQDWFKFVQKDRFEL